MNERAKAKAAFEATRDAKPFDYDAYSETRSAWRQIWGWDLGSEPSREEQRLVKLHRWGIKSVWKR